MQEGFFGEQFGRGVGDEFLRRRGIPGSPGAAPGHTEMQECLIDAMPSPTPSAWLHVSLLN